MLLLSCRLGGPKTRKVRAQVDDPVDAAGTHHLRDGSLALVLLQRRGLHFVEMLFISVSRNEWDQGRAMDLQGNGHKCSKLGR